MMIAVPLGKARLVARVSTACDPDASAVLNGFGGLMLGLGIKQVEGCDLVTINTFDLLGANVPHGVIDGLAMADCGTGAEKALFRNKYATYLVAQCKQFSRYAKGEGLEAQKKTAVTQVKLWLLQLQQALVARSAGAPAGGGGGTVYVTASNEEERQHSNPKYTDADVRTGIATIECMYNFTIAQFLRPALSVFKKVDFAAKEGTFPNPDLVKLELFRLVATDSSFVLFKRLLLCVSTVFAGITVDSFEVAGSQVRDESAGVWQPKKFASQMCNHNKVVALLQELEAQRDALSDATMGGIVDVIYKSLFASTARGKCSPSLAIAQQIPKVVEHVHAASSSGGGGGAKSGAPAAAPKTPRVRSPGKVRAKKSRTAAPAVASPKVVSGVSPNYKGKFPDKEGVEGPNGLKKMVGGNPAGTPCTDFNKPAGCSWVHCSWAHVKTK